MAWECLVKEQRPRLLTHANSAQRACRSTIAADRFAHEQGPAGRWQRTAKVTLSMRHVLVPPPTRARFLYGSETQVFEAAIATGNPVVWC